MAPLLAQVRVDWILEGELSECERQSKRLGFSRTASSVFPLRVVCDFESGELRRRLVAAFERPVASSSSSSSSSSLSVGARALCKHHVRVALLAAPNQNSLRGAMNAIPHPFWNSPTGSDANKNATALAHLNDLLDLCFGSTNPDDCWKNIHCIHPNDTCIIEIRNTVTFHGMRWTVLFASDKDVDSEYTLEFRGFLEPL